MRASCKPNLASSIADRERITRSASQKFPLVGRRERMDAFARSLARDVIRAPHLILIRGDAGSARRGSRRDARVGGAAGVSGRTGAIVTRRRER
jgi:hypothetical protein